MDSKYEIENIFPKSLSFEDIKSCICRKLASIIINEENENCTF